MTGKRNSVCVPIHTYYVANCRPNNRCMSLLIQILSFVIGTQSVIVNSEVCGIFKASVYTVFRVNIVFLTVMYR